MIDVSVLIVHYNTPGLLAQTLRGLRRAAPRLNYEVVVVDNNPKIRVGAVVAKEFPEAKLIVSDRNLGFGAGMNAAMRLAQGRYFFVFNPDIATLPGALEKLVEYLDQAPDVGMVGPRLNHPDGSVQFSCYRFMSPAVILYRRLPWLRWLPSARRAIADYLMADWDHQSVRDVDYLLGAAMLIRRTAVEAVGGFDPNYFIYFEDQDLCRRFWLAGWRVVYQPAARLIHYHRRETAAGGFFAQLCNPLTRKQMKSALYYYRKYRGQGNPRRRV
jgi:hypothetical protein